MGLFQRLNQINLRVKDIRKSVNWYQDVLGLRVKHDYETTVVLGFTDEENEESTICLIELGENETLPGDAATGTYPVFAISPEHAETCHSELKKMGVAVEGEKPAHFKFHDPDGNLLEAYLPGVYTEERFAHLR